jgi:starch-binding outer membrane protein, SusD/RagB family
MKKRIYFKVILAAVFLAGSITACNEDFLTVTPNGALDGQVLATADGVDGLLIGAYSMLDGISSQGTGGWEAASSNWVFGSIRGMEANKGTDSGDQPDINPIQNYSEAATNPYLNLKWRSVYEAVSRCNNTLVTLDIALANGTVTDAQAESFRKQARTLRGWYHFEAYRMWAKADGSGTGIPFVEQDTDLQTLTNDVDVRPMILADLDQGRTLPNNMGQVGRFNGTVAKFLWAKAQMYMYKDYAAALPVLQDVADNGTNPVGQKAGLFPTYGEIFDIEFRNDIESIYTVQYSVNDGSGAWNGGWGEVLNFPYKGGGSPGGCCGFFNPTQEFVNSFRTSGGLPLLDHSYNNQPVVNDQGLGIEDPFTPDTGPLDPRLDWTVGRRGIPYWDWGPHTGRDWIRDQTYSGPFNPKKQVYKKEQEGQYTEVGNWTSGWTANGYRMIRYSDVLLRIAECKAMLGQGDLGLAEVNLVRNRAANPAGFVKHDDGSNAANYVINPYPSFASQEQAIAAIQMERKLELGMEGHRYFDLQRWGNVVPELQRVYNYERTMPWANSLYPDFQLGPEDVNYPLPERQIDLSGGNLRQNR